MTIFYKKVPVIVIEKLPNCNENTLREKSRGGMNKYM